MKAVLGFTCLLLSMLLLGGCAILPSQFQVQVDAIKSSGSEQKSYLLLPGREEVMDDDKQFSIYADQVHRVLKAKGFVPAESFREAKVAIFLSYGIGDPQEHLLTYSLPTWGQSVVITPSPNAQDVSGGRKSTRSSAKATAQGFDPWGQNSAVARYQTHERFLLLDAFDLREHRRSVKDVQLWRTSAKSTGKRAELERVFPALLAAAQPFIATDSGGQVEVKIQEDSEGVAKVVGERKTQPLVPSSTQEPGDGP